MGDKRERVEEVMKERGGWKDRGGGRAGSGETQN